jgi:hypothetical protein
MRPLLQKEIARLEEQKKRLVDAYVYEQAIDQDTYRRELARISQDLTLVKVEHHGNEIDALDVEAVLEFAEYVVLNARRLWKEFPLPLRRRMQKVLFPEGLVYAGEVFRTPVSCLFFRDLEAPKRELQKVVAQAVPTWNQAVPSWNQIGRWTREIDPLRKCLPQALATV